MAFRVCYPNTTTRLHAICPPVGYVLKPHAASPSGSSSKYYARGRDFLPFQKRCENHNITAPTIPCTQPSCPVLFKRASDIPRHIATAHGINQRIHFCPVLGCNKSFGRGYTRADKVKVRII
jgi:hypothetical protein